MTRTLLATFALVLLLGCAGDEEQPAGPPAVEATEGASPEAPPADGDSADRVPGIDLPRVGSVGAVPDRRLTVEVDAEGRIVVEGEQLDLEALGGLLVDRASADRTGPHGPSHLDVVLRLDRTLPWGVAQWLMQECADPDAMIWRIHFAVLPEEGSEEGAMAAFLPLDRGLGKTPSRLDERVTIETRIQLEKAGPGSDPAALWAHVRPILAADATLPGEIAADRLVPTGYVLRVLDVLLRSGVKEISFRGNPPPRGPDAIAALIERARAAEGVPTIRLFGETVGPEATVAPPSATRNPPRIDRLSDEFEEQLEEIPAEEIPLEKVVPEEIPLTMRDVPIEEPTIREDEVHDAFDDPPFEGPPSGAKIGIGGGAGSAFGGRSGRLLRPEGPVGLGLDWLASHQSPDGSWKCHLFEEQCKLNRCGGAGLAEHTTGVTGLALLAFLGAGETHRAGEHRQAIKRGLVWLIQHQDPEGCFGFRDETGFVYGHAIATLAMAEAFALTGSPLFKASAQRAVDFIEKCRNPYLAWRYGIRPQDNDTSVTAWMVCALASAKSGGLRVPPEAFEGARAWIDKVTEPEFGRAGYTARGTGPSRPDGRGEAFPADRSEGTTAMGMLIRMRCGEDTRTSEMIRKGAELCLKQLPEWDETGGSIDLVYWSFGTMAMFRVAGDPWKAWNVALKTTVLDHQRKDGDQKGSWDPVGVWGPAGGRVYATVMGVLCAEVYFRGEPFGVR